MMMNPVLRREARTSFRNWRLYGAFTLYITTVVSGTILYLYLMMSQSFYYGFDPQVIIGLYSILCGMQLGLVLIGAPALTAGSISGERERQTLDLLLITKMSPYSIVIGKMMSSMGILVLLILSTMPVFAIVFYFGGVSLISLFAMTGYVLLVGAMASAISIFFSSIFKKTVMAMVCSYLVMGFLCVGTIIVVGFYQSIYQALYLHSSGALSSIVFLSANPWMGFVSILENQIGFSGVLDIFGSNLENEGTLRTIVDNYWVVNVVTYVAITGVFSWLAAHFINRVKKKK